MPDLKEYIRNQNILSQLESITISKNSASPTIMEYDGILYFAGSVRREYTGTSDAKYYLNGIGLSACDHYDWSNFGNASLIVSKGDTLYLDSGWYGQNIKARWYKLRDYTGR